ncbi:SDR family NAD(P)-dependent oxidoreductase [bacterium]|nr:SDR family NAD(P)-dependent oxidoreductase [bacterium]
MHIIVTGATGFIGRTIAERFHEEGINILALGRDMDKGENLRRRGLRFQRADIRSADQVMGAFEAADCVIHCAGKSADWGRPEEFEAVNVDGTHHIIDACRVHSIHKLIFVSTPSVYYSGRDRFRIREEDPLPAPRTWYARTKLKAERELLNASRDGLQFITFRPRAVYGPYDNTIVPRILALAEKKQFPLLNGGNALTDITYIDNFVDAVRSALPAPETAWNQVYNISNGDPIRIRDWFETVLHIFDIPFRPKFVPEIAAKAVATVMETSSRLPFGPKKPAMTRFSVGYMAKSMTMSIEKAQTQLSYVPRIGNREGFERYAAWYRTRKRS